MSHVIAVLPLVAAIEAAIDPALGQIGLDQSGPTTPITLVEASYPGAPAGLFEVVIAQPAASLSWVINHNLGRRPAITLLNAGAQEIEGALIHLSDNQAVATFAVPVAGEARCI